MGPELREVDFGFFDSLKSIAEFLDFKLPFQGVLKKDYSIQSIYLVLRLEEYPSGFHLFNHIHKVHTVLHIPDSKK